MRKFHNTLPYPDYKEALKTLPALPSAEAVVAAAPCELQPEVTAPDTAARDSLLKQIARVVAMEAMEDRNYKLNQLSVVSPDSKEILGNYGHNKQEYSEQLLGRSRLGFDHAKGPRDFEQGLRTDMIALYESAGNSRELSRIQERLDYDALCKAARSLSGYDPIADEHKKVIGTNHLAGAFAVVGHQGESAQRLLARGLHGEFDSHER